MGRITSCTLILILACLTLIDNILTEIASTVIEIVLINTAETSLFCTFQTMIQDRLAADTGSIGLYKVGSNNTGDALGSREKAVTILLLAFLTLVAALVIEVSFTFAQFVNSEVISVVISGSV